MRIQVLLGSLLLLGFGCGSKGSDGGAPAPTDSAPLAQSVGELEACATGIWVRVERACNCPTGSLLETVECSAADCREFDALLLQASKDSFEAVARSSDSKNSLSIVGGPGGVPKSRWSVLATRQLSQQYSARVYATDLTCRDSVMERPGVARYTRPTKEREQALERAAATGWSPVSLR